MARIAYAYSCSAKTWNIGKERCGQLWAKAGLQVPKKRGRKRPGTTLRPLASTARNSVWSYDFVYDACANGQKLKCLTVIDEYTRECLAIDVNGAIRSSHVIEVLSKDKKKSKDSIHFILLEKIGKAIMQPISIDQIYQSL